MYNLLPASQKILDNAFHAIIENIHIDQWLNCITPLINIKFIRENSETCLCYLRSLREPSNNAALFNAIPHQCLNIENKDYNQIVNNRSSDSISPLIPTYFKLQCSSRMLLRSQSTGVFYPSEFENTKENSEIYSKYNFQNNELPDISEIAKKISNMIEIGEGTLTRSKSVSDLDSMYLKISQNKIEYFYNQLENLQQLTVFLSTKINNEKLIYPIQQMKNDLQNIELISLFLHCWNTVVNFLRNGVNDQKKIQVINTLGLPLAAGMLFLVGENLDNKIDCSVLRSWSTHHIMDLLAFNYEKSGDFIDPNLKSKVIEFQSMILNAVDEKFKKEANLRLADLTTLSVRVKSIQELYKEISGMNFWDIVQFEEKITSAEKLGHELDPDGNLKNEYKKIRKNLESEISLDPLSSVHAWFNYLDNLLKIN